MNRIFQVAFVTTLIVVSTPSVALADAVPPPPADCPAGTFGETSHSGQWCATTTCETDTDCVGKDRSDYEHKKKYVCRVQPLCVETVPLGRGEHPGEVGRRTCTTDADCVRPETCVSVKRCVDEKTPPPPDPPPPTKSASASPRPRTADVTSDDDEKPRRDRHKTEDGCSCGAPAAVVGSPWAVFLLVVLRRRRATKRSA